jgi:FG-GAP repeat
MKSLFVGFVLSFAIASAATTELLAPTPQPDAFYGWNVAASGNTLAVIQGNNATEIYLYEPTVKSWNSPKLVAELTTSAGAAFSNVAIYGNVVIAGAPAGSANPGAVYGYIEPKGGWQNATESFTLTASDGANGDNFGFSVAISAKTIMVGANMHVVNGIQQGAAYVFAEPASGWATATQTAKLTPSDHRTDFGQSVGVNGPVAVVGSIGLNGGSVYVFQETVGGWQNSTETAQLTDSSCQGLGQAVAIWENTIVAGSEWCNASVDVYNRPGSAWQSMSAPTAYLSSSKTIYCVPYRNCFGSSLALTNKFLLVGAPYATTSSNIHVKPTGYAFVFDAPQGGWQSVVNAVSNEMIEPGGGFAQSRFGFSVAAESTGVLFIGAPALTVDGDAFAGAVVIK